jgi:hypothetical protein
LIFLMALLDEIQNLFLQYSFYKWPLSKLLK